ncbi:MAG TPA: universal stress protein [Puia sp.]|nr:universal stress protein [Puia sp.]
MRAAFRKILIPVDFSLSTETAVKKAIGIIDPDNAHIHLLHVVKRGSSAAIQLMVRDAERKLAQWKVTIEETTPGVEARTSILRGSSVQRMIIESAGLVAPDLIIIGKKGTRRHRLFHQHISPDRIAEKSNCPVLTAKPGSIHSRTKIIVIPIRHFVPERKLDLAILIAQKYRARVHLLAIGGNDNDEKDGLSQTFIKTYDHLRRKLQRPVEYFSVGRHNPARAALDYAKFVMADMILVNPATESGIYGLTGSRHISDLIAADSKIQVLDVMPYA